MSKTHGMYGTRTNSIWRTIGIPRERINARLRAHGEKNMAFVLSTKDLR